MKVVQASDISWSKGQIQLEFWGSEHYRYLAKGPVNEVKPFVL